MVRRALLSILIVCVFFTFQAGVVFAVDGEMQDFLKWVQRTDGITNNFASYDQLKAGQTTAQCLTVLRGTQRTACELQYVGTIAHPCSSQQRLLVFRIGKPLDDATAVAGMSGSPVYVFLNGEWKLVGAYVYRLNMLAANGRYLAGVTPIQAMLDQDAAVNIVKGQGILSGDGNKTKLFYKSRIRPGDALSAVLAMGDYDLYSTGTVTYVDPQQGTFIAYGHPFLRDLGFGSVRVPVYRTEIAVTDLNHYDSSKLPSRLRERVGTIVRDGQFGIEGTMEELSDVLLPISFSIDADGRKVEYKFSVVRDPVLSGLIMQKGLEELALGVQPFIVENDSSVQTETFLKVTDRLEPFVIRRSKIVIAPNTWLAILGDLTDKVSNIIFNKTWNLQADEIQVKLNLRSQIHRLVLESCRLVDNEGKEIESITVGQKIKIVLFARTLNGSKKYILQIPYEVPKLQFKNGSELKIRIQSGSNFESYDVNGQIYFFDNPGEFLEHLSKSYNGGDLNKLYVQIVLPPSEEESIILGSSISNGWQELGPGSTRPQKAQPQILLKVYDSPNKDGNTILDIQWEKSFSLDE